MLSEKLISVEKYSIHLALSTSPLWQIRWPSSSSSTLLVLFLRWLFWKRQVRGTKIIQPINIPEWIQGRIRNSFSGEIFRHSDTRQATNGWQEQFQIQSPEIHRAQFMLQKKNMARNRFSDKILKVAIEKNNTIVSLKYWLNWSLKFKECKCHDLLISCYKIAYAVSWDV